MEVFKTNNHDYSSFIEVKGVNWSRNDLDTDQTKRTKDGLMRRQKIGTKRKLSYKMIHMTQAELAQLDDDLSRTTFEATYSDVHGQQTRKFYCSSFSATLEWVDELSTYWAEAAFSIIEV